jgi:hypothetical protein
MITVYDGHFGTNDLLIDLLCLAGLCKLQKNGALDLQPQVIMFTSCLPMVSGFLRVLRLLPPLKLVAMI